MSEKPPTYEIFSYDVLHKRFSGYFRYIDPKLKAPLPGLINELSSIKQGPKTIKEIQAHLVKCDDDFGDSQPHAGIVMLMLRKRWVYKFYFSPDKEMEKILEEDYKEEYRRKLICNLYQRRNACK